MQISDIFEAVVNSPDLKMSFKLPNSLYNLESIHRLKRDISNYKFRHKAIYEEAIGSFDLRYDIDHNEVKEYYVLTITVEETDKSRHIQGVEIHGN